MQREFAAYDLLRDLLDQLEQFLTTLVLQLAQVLFDLLADLLQWLCGQFEFATAFTAPLLASFTPSSRPCSKPA
jgi:hypothetical protein